MSQIRHLFDHDIDGPIISGVRRREPAMGAVRVQDVMPRDTPDPNVLAYAADHGYVLVTGDARSMIGFAKDRMAAGEPMTGLFVARRHLKYAVVIESLVLA